MARSPRRLGKWLAGAVGSALPLCCYADYGGNWLHFGPAEEFALFALIALPSAVACLLIEAIVPRRHVPWWLSTPAGCIAAAAMLLAVFSGVGSDFVFAWLIVPPAATLALRGAVSDPMERLMAGWITAAAAMAIALVEHHGPDDSFILLGGAASCMLLWSSTVLVLVTRNIAPEPGRVRTQHSQLRAAMAALAPVAARLRALMYPVFAGMERVLQPAQVGLVWWLSATLVFYFGIGAAIAAGKLSGGAWIYSELQQLFDTFEVPLPKMLAPKQLWWFVGLPWSLLAGAAVWGLAGTIGIFNAGRARIARLAGIVFGGALLVWTALTIVRVDEIDAAEQRATGIDR